MAEGAPSTHKEDSCPDEVFDDKSTTGFVWATLAEVKKAKKGFENTENHFNSIPKENLTKVSELVR